MEKRRFNEPKAKEYEELVISVNRVTKVTKGGRHFRFAATVVVGDRKGTVGFGTGIIAGGSVRAVLELAGVKDVVSKSLGSNSKINVVRATMNALTSQRSAEHIAALRGKTVEELFN